MFLTSTVQKLQSLMGAVVTTTNPSVVVDWVDIVVATGGTPGVTTSALNGTTAVDIVAAPVATTIRKINGLWIYNEDTVAQIVTVRYSDNATLRTIVKMSLNPGDTLQFTDPGGWVVLDSSGNIHSIVAAAPGSWIKRTILISGTAHVVGTTTRTIYLRLIAGGGGGGGVALNAAGNGTVAGGGAAGGYAENRFTVIPGTSYTYAIGGAGTAGASGGGTGGTGGDTTFQVGATTVTCKGGLGGVNTATGAVIAYGAGGQGVAGTNGDYQARGESGMEGMIFTAGASGLSGRGGASALGTGAAARTTTGAGNPGLGIGAGGGGALSLAAGAAQAGGGGQAGQIIVDEYT